MIKRKMTRIAHRARGDLYETRSRTNLEDFIVDDLAAIKPNSVYLLGTVAEELDVSIRSLERYVAAGDLIARRAGRHTLTTGRSLLAWLEWRSNGVNAHYGAGEEELRS
jgi:hypothetical protein